MKLSPRDQQIFQAVMALYCDGQGHPVPSSKITAHINLGVCSATVRNAMARLEKAGLLYSPHTSAGRVPSKAGFDYWFSEFFELSALEQWHPQSDKLVELAHAISQHYRVCCLVGFPEAAKTTTFRVEVLDFDAEHWLVLLFDKAGQSHNIRIQKPHEANEAIRNEFNAWLNMVFGQHNLTEGLYRMQAMAKTAPRYCHGSLAQWTKALANHLSAQSSILTGDGYLYQHHEAMVNNAIHAGLLNHIEDKLAFKEGISVLHGEDLGDEGFAGLVILSIPYFNGADYQSRFCVICERFAPISAILAEFSNLTQSKA